MKKIFLLSLVFLLSGCWNLQTWKYTSEAKNYQVPVSPKTVAVLPFRDVRPNKNNTDGQLVALIPFVPYSRMCEFNTPEGLPLLMENMGSANEALAKSTSEEVNHASIFQNVHYADNPQKSELILEGTLKEFKIEDYWTFYGLSVFGELGWAVGLPYGKEYNTITIQYRLVNSSGKEFFKKEYSKQEAWEYSLYKDLENFRFEKLMKQINMELVDDLKKVAPKLQ